jgi:hypothetical protein
MYKLQWDSEREKVIIPNLLFGLKWLACNFAEASKCLVNDESKIVARLPIFESG